MARTSPLRTGLVGVAPPVPVEGYVYVHDGPGPDAKLLSVYKARQRITAEQPRIWFSIGGAPGSDTEPVVSHDGDMWQIVDGRKT